MSRAQIVLEYVRVILAWPAVVAIVALTFVVLFRAQIGDLIGRIFKIKFPGGELFASQQQKSKEEIAPKTVPPDVPPAELPQDITLTPDQRQQMVQVLQSERANAALWEYRYLNYYLARSTQTVLDWFATLPQPIGLNLVDSHLQTFIPSAGERGAILTALQNHHLIQRTGDLLAITPKGREYLQWRGPLLPPSGPA